MAADQAPVAWRLKKTSNWINHYPLDSAACFANIYPLASDLTGR